MQLYSEEEIHRIKSALDRQLKEIVIVRLNTKLVDPETLQRYEGKARRVEDLRYIEK
jgi:phenylacetate-coenzyme A ligase PaaK-like adenylate-forming protein